VKVKEIWLKNFGAFQEAHFEFSPNVNVFIGENGTGKSHVLKLLYSAIEALRESEGKTRKTAAPGKGIGEVLTSRLMETFRPDSIGRLVRRGVGKRRGSIEVSFGGPRNGKISASLYSEAKLSVTSSSANPPSQPAVFLPTREVISIYPGFISAYSKRETEFDRTYFDLCLALDARPLRGPRSRRIAKLLAPLEEALNGTVRVENGRFYVELPDGMIEMPLVAEGLRKLATVAYLAVNGSLSENGYLFWDEPEANLNPRLI
jgi:hypothetical protein